MKTIKLLFAATIVASLIFTACENPNKTKAEKAIENYEHYLDSISNLAAADIAAHWDAIQAELNAKKAELEASLEGLKDKKPYEEKITMISKKADEFNKKMEVEVKKQKEINTKVSFRKSIFNHEIGENLDFSWVNKDNILNVYQNFVSTVDKNKESYTREQWDDLKDLYEALDSRKNTVEKEGLTTKDNLKIAGLKVKFAPMYKLYRMDAKIEENQKAKE